MTNKTNEQLDGRAARAIMSLFSEQDRLARLSPAELIVETLNGEAADYLVVEELMNRVLPGWENDAEVDRLVTGGGRE